MFRRFDINSSHILYPLLASKPIYLVDEKAGNRVDAILRYENNTIFVIGYGENINIECADIFGNLDLCNRNIHQIEIDNPNATVRIALNVNFLSHLNRINANTRKLILSKANTLLSTSADSKSLQSLTLNCQSSDVTISSDLSLRIHHNFNLHCLNFKNEGKITVEGDALLNIHIGGMSNTSSLYARNSCQIENAQYLDIRGEIMTPGRLYLSVKENIQVSEQAKLHGDRGMAIWAKKMNLVGNAELVSNHHMIVIDRNFKTGPGTAIRSEADEGLVLLELPETNLLDRNLMKLILQEFPNSALLIKKKISQEPEDENQLKLCFPGFSNIEDFRNAHLVGKEVYYAYRYFEKDSEVLVRIQKPPHAMQRIIFSVEPFLADFTKMDPYVIHCLKAHRVYQSKFMLSVGEKVRISGTVDVDETLMSSKSHRYHRTARLQGDLRSLICTDYYWNSGKIELNRNFAMLEIRANRSAVNGISKRTVFKELPIKQLLFSPFSEELRAKHQANFIKIISPISFEVFAHRNANIQKGIFLGRFSAFNLKNIHIERNTQLLNQEVLDIPDVAVLISDFKKAITDITVGDFGGLTSRLSFESIGNFLLFLIRRIFPAIGSLANIAYSLVFLLKNSQAFYSLCYALYNKYQNNEIISVADVLETLEPLLAAVSPAATSMMQLNDHWHSPDVETINQMLAANNPFTTWDRFLSLMGDIAALPLSSSSNSSVFSVQVLSLVPGTKVDNSIVQVGLGLDAAVNRNVISVVEKDMGFEFARHLSKTTASLDMRNTRTFTEDISIQTTELKIDETTHLISVACHLNSPHLPVQDLLSKQGDFKNVDIGDIDASTSDKVTIDKPIKSAGEIRVSTKSEEGFELKAPIEGDSISITAPQGNLQVIAPLSAAHELSISGKNISISHTSMRGNTTQIHATNDVNVLASTINGVSATTINAGHDIFNQREMHLRRNPKGGTIANWDESAITSSEGRLAETAGNQIVTNGVNSGLMETKLTGEKGIEARASKHPYIVAIIPESSAWGLSKSVKTIRSEQVSQPVIGSTQGKTILNAPNGNVILQAVDFPGDTEFKGLSTINEPLIIETSVTTDTKLLNGFLGEAHDEQKNQQCITTNIHINEKTEFQAKETILTDVNIFGTGILKFSGDSVDIHSSTLNHSKKRKVKGFHVGVDVPLLSAVENVASEAKELVESESVSEVLVNGIATGVDAAMTGSQALKTANALKRGFSSENSQDLLKSLPLSAKLSYSCETTEIHTQTTGTGSIQVHHIEVNTTESFRTEEPISADEGIFHTPTIEITGNELKNTAESKNWGVGIEASFSGIENVDAQYGVSYGKSTIYQPNSVNIRDLELHADEFKLKNGSVNAENLRGTVDHVNIYSSPNTGSSHQSGGHLSTSTLGFQTSQLDFSSTQQSTLNVKNASNFEAKSINLEGGKFTASNAKIGKTTDIPVDDFCKEESLGFSLNFGEFTNSNNSSISVPVRAQFHETTLKQKVSSKGTEVIEQHHHGYNVVVPWMENNAEENFLSSEVELLHEEILLDKEENPLLDDSVMKSDSSEPWDFEESHSTAYVEPDIDPLTYDPKADLNVMLESFHSDSLAAKNHEQKESQKYLKSAASGVVHAIKDTINRPISFLYDLSVIALKKESDNLHDLNLSMDPLIDSITYKNASQRMFGRVEEFENSMASLNDAVIRAGIFGMTTFIPNRPLLSSEQEAIDRGVRSWTNCIDHYNSLSGPQLVGEISYELTSFAVFPAIFKASKYLANEYWYDLTYNPPLYQNLYPDRATTSHSLLIFDEVRQQDEFNKYIYIINHQGDLLISGDKFYESSHLNLSNNQPVMTAGEIGIKDSQITYINTNSGHYRPQGDHLQTLTERVFQRHGFDEAKGKFDGFDNDERKGLQVHPIIEEIKDQMLPIYTAGGINSQLAQQSHLSNQTPKKINDEDQSTNNPLMASSTKVTLLKIIKSMDEEIGSVRILGKITKGELFFEMGKNVLSSEDNNANHVLKLEQQVAKFIATSKCTGHAFSFFKAIPVVGQSPLSILAFPAIFVGCSIVVGGAAEKAATLAYNEADISAMENEAYVQTMTNL